MGSGLGVRARAHGAEGVGPAVEEQLAAEAGVGHDALVPVGARLVRGWGWRLGLGVRGWGWGWGLGVRG